MTIPPITPIFTVSKELYEIAYELGFDTSASIEYGITDVVYKVHCTQQEYIILKVILREKETLI